MRTRIKICGITRPQDAEQAVSLGVDALGLVFAQKSPRRVSLEAAKTIATRVPPFVSLVALFMDNTSSEIQSVLDNCRIEVLQFHGGETPDQCSRFGRTYIKAVPMGGGVDPNDYMNQFSDAGAFLVDSHGAGEQGGSGLTFNWDIIPATPKPLILAGGLNADNVAQAIRHVKPYAVDVSSGVEVAKGVKDYEKMRAFVRAVAEGDQ